MLNRIGHKLIIAVGLTAIIIIGVYAYVNIQSQSEVLLNEVGRHASQLSETVKNSTHIDMLSNSREHLGKIIQTIGQGSCIQVVRIFNKDGQIIYSDKEDDVGRFVDKDTESCKMCHAAEKPVEQLTISERTRIYKMNPDSARVLSIITPIYNQQTCWEAECHAHPQKDKILGVLDITLCLREIDASIERSELKAVLFAAFAIIGISFIIGIFVRRWVVNPVNKLVTATDHVSVGDLNYTLDNISKDELGQLADSFNNMTSKLSEMRQQIFQSEKLASLGQLAAGVAHEINNPLTGVLTYSSFLQKRMKDNPEVKEDLDVIVRETKRCREIVKGLLDFARQSTPKKNSVDVNQIIEKSATVVNNELKIKQIELEKNFGANLPEIIADANQIQQIFLNLLVNSIDAVPKGTGKITIATSLLTLSPVGIAQVKGATCKNNHNLIDNNHKIEGVPSIKVKAEAKGIEGEVYIDAIFGKHQNQYNLPIHNNEILKLYCTECSVPLFDDKRECPVCKAPLYQMHTPGKGTLNGCTRFGCTWQKWDFVDEQKEYRFIQIIFSDNGNGIPKENLDKIFDPFFSTKGQSGTGLGLSVIWGILDNHDGKISVESELGKGTAFKIILPVEKI